MLFTTSLFCLQPFLIHSDLPCLRFNNKIWLRLTISERDTRYVEKSLELHIVRAFWCCPVTSTDWWSGSGSFRALSAKRFLGGSHPSIPLSKTGIKSPPTETPFRPAVSPPPQENGQRWELCWGGRHWISWVGRDRRCYHRS